jgi:hypothetical protein
MWWFWSVPTPHYEDEKSLNALSAFQSQRDYCLGVAVMGGIAYFFRRIAVWAKDPTGKQVTFWVFLCTGIVFPLYNWSAAWWYSSSITPTEQWAVNRNRSRQQEKGGRNGNELDPATVAAQEEAKRIAAEKVERARKVRTSLGRAFVAVPDLIEFQMASDAQEKAYVWTFFSLLGWENGTLLTGMYQPDHMPPLQRLVLRYADGAEPSFANGSQFIIEKGQAAVCYVRGIFLMPLIGTRKPYHLSLLRQPPRGKEFITTISGRGVLKRYVAEPIKGPATVLWGIVPQSEGRLWVSLHKANGELLSRDAFSIEPPVEVSIGKEVQEWDLYALQETPAIVAIPIAAASNADREVTLQLKTKDALWICVTLVLEK